MPLYGGSALACAMYVFGYRSLFKLLGGVALLMGGIRLKETVSIPNSMAELAKYYDFDTELGRETGGLTILMVWFIVMIMVDEYQAELALKEAVGEAKKNEDGKVEPKKSAGKAAKPLFEWILVGGAAAVLLSTWIVPKFFMHGPAAEDHCNGVGFSAPKRE